MKLRVGDKFTIRQRYNRGTYPHIVISRVVGRHVWVRDFWSVPEPAFLQRERRFVPAQNAREVLTRYWKRYVAARPDGSKER
jgi:hypothetical protein